MNTKENKLYQIGKVSKLCNISIKTLRYYDEIGLLKPRVTDEFTGYRYYSTDQLIYILTIKHLKEAGFPLKEIKTLLARENIEYNRSKFTEKCKEIDDKINDLVRIRNKLQFCINEDIEKNTQRNDTSCKIKYVEDMYIAYLRGRWHTTPEEFTVRYCSLMSLIERNNFHTTKNVMALYHDDFNSYIGNDNMCDIEVCAVVSETSEIPVRSENLEDLELFL